MKGELRVLNSSGDSLIEWDTEKKDGPLDPAYAQAEFKRLVAEGHLAFVDTSTPTKKRAEQIETFDPTQHEKVILSPAFVGG